MRARNDSEQKNETELKLKEQSEQFLKWINLESGCTILDVGTGEGFFTLSLAEHQSTEIAIGVDLFSHQLRKAKEKLGKRNLLSKADLICCDLGHLPIRDSSVDVVISDFTFHDLLLSGSVQDVINELNRVVKQGKKIVIRDTFLYKPKNRAEETYFEGERILHKLLKNVYKMDIWSIHKIEDYKTLLINAGFKDIQVKVIKPEIYVPKDETMQWFEEEFSRLLKKIVDKDVLHRAQLERVCFLGLLEKFGYKLSESFFISGRKIP